MKNWGRLTSIVVFSNMAKIKSFFQSLDYCLPFLAVQKLDSMQWKWVRCIPDFPDEVKTVMVTRVGPLRRIFYFQIAHSSGVATDAESQIPPNQTDIDPHKKSRQSWQGVWAGDLPECDPSGEKVLVYFFRHLILAYFFKDAVSLQVRKKCLCTFFLWRVTFHNKILLWWQ